MFFFSNILRNDCTKSMFFLSIEDPLVSATFVFFLSCSFVVLNFSNSPRINEYSTLEMLLSSRALDIISFTEFSFDSIKILMFSCFSKRKLSFLPISLAIRHRSPSPPAVPMSGNANTPVSRVPTTVSVEVVKCRNACSECTILRTLRLLKPNVMVTGQNSYLECLFLIENPIKIRIVDSMVSKHNGHIKALSLQFSHKTA